jgi:hypothetical protein
MRIAEDMDADSSTCRSEAEDRSVCAFHSLEKA